MRRRLWRPTLRCDLTYKTYIDSLSQVTILDKNQIMRLMMFIAAHSSEFKSVIDEYRNPETTLPTPGWEAWEDVYWLKQTYAGATRETIDIKEISIKVNGGIVVVKE